MDSINNKKIGGVRVEKQENKKKTELFDKACQNYLDSVDESLDNYLFCGSIVDDLQKTTWNFKKPIK